MEKLDVATDVFEGLVPGTVKPSASVSVFYRALLSLVAVKHSFSANKLSFNFIMYIFVICFQLLTDKSFTVCS